MENQKEMLFRKATEAWLEGKKAKIKRSTYYQYLSVIQNHIDQELGKVPLNEIDNHLVCDFFNGLSCGKNEPLSPSTVKSIVYITKAVLNYSVHMGLMKDFKIYFESPGKSRKREAVLSHQEELLLSRYLLKNQTPENMGIILAMYTGIRLGELCALKWSHINLREKYIYIDKTVSRLPDSGDTRKTKLVLELPKSATSTRCIPLPDFLVKMLEQMEEQYCPEDFLLSGNKQKIPDPRTMQNRFKCCEAMAEIHEYNFHILRHTFATRCVELGFDVKSLSEILGHASVNITLNRYVHSSMDMKKKQMLLLQQGWVKIVSDSPEELS